MLKEAYEKMSNEMCQNVKLEQSIDLTFFLQKKGVEFHLSSLWNYRIGTYNQKSIYETLPNQIFLLPTARYKHVAYSNVKIV